MSPVHPLSPRLVVYIRFLTFILCDLQVGHSPPVFRAALPPCLAHETDHSFLLGPALLDCNIGQICRAVTSPVIEKTDTNSVLVKIPVQGTCARCEVHKEGDVARKCG